MPEFGFLLVKIYHCTCVLHKQLQTPKQNFINCGRKRRYQNPSAMANTSTGAQSCRSESTRKQSFEHTRICKSLVDWSLGDGRTKPLGPGQGLPTRRTGPGWVEPTNFQTGLGWTSPPSRLAFPTPIIRSPSGHNATCH